MRVIIIIPTYNEKENIAKIVPEINSFCPEVNILVVDDNSPDKTYEVVREMQKSMPRLSLLLREKKEGLGKAYINAFQTVLKVGDSDAIIMMDADFSHDPKYLPLFLEEAQNQNYDVVFGSRYVKGGGIYGWDAWRKFLSKFANFYARNIVRMPIFDYTAGFILIKTELLARIDLDKIGSTGYAFLMELKSFLWKAGGRFKEVPIVLGNRTVGKSKMSGKIIWEGVLAPWKIRKNHFKKSKSPEENYFFDLDLKEIKNKFIFLDIDGTIVSDGVDNIEEKVKHKLRELVRENKVVFCSNKKNPLRSQSFVELTNIPHINIYHRKPSKKILKFVENNDNLPTVVIGDKFLTDGLFARNINAEFIKVKRLRGAGEGAFNKLAYLLDDLIYALL